MLWCDVASSKPWGKHKYVELLSCRLKVTPWSDFIYSCSTCVCVCPCRMYLVPIYLLLNCRVKEYTVQCTNCARETDNGLRLNRRKPKKATTECVRANWATTIRNSRIAKSVGWIDWARRAFRWFEQFLIRVARPTSEWLCIYLYTSENEFNITSDITRVTLLTPSCPLASVVLRLIVDVIQIEVWTPTHLL